MQQEKQESFGKPTETVIVEVPENLQVDPGKLVDPTKKEESLIMEFGIFENFCRICLQSGEFESLFETSSENQCYADQLEDCFRIRVRNLWISSWYS